MHWEGCYEIKVLAREKMVLEPSHRRVRQRTGGRDIGVLERVWDI